MRSGSKYDWVPLFWSEGFGGGNASPGEPHRLALVNMEPTTQVTTAGDVTIERIVGQIVVFARTNDVVPIQPSLIHARIRAPVPIDVDNLQFLETDFENTPGDFDSATLPSIMWHRVYPLTQNTLTGSYDGDETNYLGANGFASSLVDCRVKRRLTAGEGCMLELGPMGPSTATTPVVFLTYGVWLRGLLKFH